MLLKDRIFKFCFILLLSSFHEGWDNVWFCLVPRAVPGTQQGLYIFLKEWMHTGGRECDMDILGNEEDRAEDANLLGAGTLELNRS